ncbi:GTP-binding protein [Lactarius hengduanensis]|nr:GTP-binding protein [Lactarius hengduanensis]
MDTQQPSRRAPKIKFRVLIIGRANAGKTSILQRICETTESPIIYRRGDDSDEEVKLDPTMDRGEHSIDDQLVFSNHTGYVFHDSCGIESGCTKELEVLREFIGRKCSEKQLGDRLHAICFGEMSQIDLMDYGNPDDNVTEVTEKLFQEHYVHPLGDHVVFVRLEQMHRQNRRCDDLIGKTAAALNEEMVTLMLLTVQKGNLELSVKTALKRLVCQLKWRSK